MGRQSPAPRRPPTHWSGQAHISRATDVDEVLATVTATAGRRTGTADLRRPVTPAAEVDPDQRRHELLPVHPTLAGLLPDGGLRRGSTVVATGATSLMVALIAEASRIGSWAAVVGMPALGALAVAESGAALERLALVPHPGEQWARVVGILLDGLDLVVVNPAGEVDAGVARNLAARARRHGAVLVSTGQWPGADLTLSTPGPRWEGLGAGRGRLRRAEMTVTAVGRGAAVRRREATVPIPLPPPGPPDRGQPQRFRHDQEQSLSA